MIKIIAGAKGSGKTKRIMDLANETVETAKGNVVYICNDKTNSINISFKIKFIDMTIYEKFSPNGFGNFLAGLCAGNSDIETIFIDGAYKVLGGMKPYEMQQFYEILEKVAKIHDVKFVLTVSCDEQDLPPFISKFERA